MVQNVVMDRIERSGKMQQQQYAKVAGIQRRQNVGNYLRSTLGRPRQPATPTSVTGNLRVLIVV